MKNRYLNFFFSFLAVLILVSVFCLFLLNIFVLELKIGTVWDLIQGTLMESEEFTPQSFSHQIGETINDPLYGGEVVKVSPSSFKEDGQNYVNVGPGIFLLPGRYRLTYDLAVSEISSYQDFAVVDVFKLSEGVETKKTLNSSQYQNTSFKKESLEFQTDGGRKFEFRVYYLGQGELKVGKARIEVMKKNYGAALKKSIKIFTKIKQVLRQ